MRVPSSRAAQLTVLFLCLATAGCSGSPAQAPLAESHSTSLETTVSPEAPTAVQALSGAKAITPDESKPEPELLETGDGTSDLDIDIYDVPPDASPELQAALAAGNELHHRLIGDLPLTPAATGAAQSEDHLVQLAQTMGLPPADAQKYIVIKLDEKDDEGPYRGRWVDLCEVHESLMAEAAAQNEAGTLSDDVFYSDESRISWLAQTIEQVHGLSPAAARVLAELDNYEVFSPASAGYCYQHASVLVFW